MPFEFKNNAISTLLSAITASQTSINIATPVVGAFSNPASGNVIACTLKVLSTHAQYESFKNYREIVYYSVSANNVLTVVRNQEGSMAPVAGWPAGTTIFTCIPSAFLNSLATEAWVEAYVAENGGESFVQADWDATEGNAVILNKPDLSDLHAAESDNQDLSGLVEKVTGYSLVADTEISKIHESGSDNQDLSGLVEKVIGYSLVSDLEIAKIHEAGSDNQDLSGLMSLSGDQSATGTKTFEAVVMAISSVPVILEAGRNIIASDFGKIIKANSASNLTFPLANGTVDGQDIWFSPVNTGQCITTGLFIDNGTNYTTMTGAVKGGMLHLKWDATIGRWQTAGGSTVWTGSN